MKPAGVDEQLLQRARQAARQAARRSGRLQIEGLRASRRVEHKGTYDLVTDVDRRCQEAIVAILQAATPSLPILAEEVAAASRLPDDGWIVDPLDGTTNYAHGYPAFCTSLALRLRGRLELGVVYEPLRDELFEARRGRGATLNGQPISVSETTELDQSLLATGFPYDRLEQPETNLDRFCVMTLRTRGVRRGGSAALDLCYTACGRLDGFWETRLFPWDVCAGALLVLEAGGRVTGLRGEDYDWSGRDTLASNGHLHQALLQALADLPPEAPFFG